MSSGEARFLLTSHLNQDSLENVFSQVRGNGDSHPSIAAFRHNLRCICLSQFTTALLLIILILLLTCWILSQSPSLVSLEVL